VALVGAAAISAMISASAGVVSLTLGGVVPSDNGLWAWLIWWMGDTTGILIGTPLLMCLPQRHRAMRLSRILVFEAITLVGFLGIATWIVFRVSEFSNAGHYPTAFAVYPFVIWGALRFGVPGAGTITLIIAFASMLTTTHEAGPFVVSLPTYSLIRWWIFNTIVATSGLLLGASSEERRAAQGALVRAKEEIEHRSKNEPAR
jgi:integral membrane sensor domain MASE1